MASTIEAKQGAIAAVRTCRTRESLEEMLARFEGEIGDAQETIAFLNECMYSPQIFYTMEPTSIEDALEFTKQTFLTGTWRLHEYYVRMGVGSVNA